MITLDLSYQTAVVTGGKSGIGQGIVQILLQSGARVISADLAYEEDYKGVDGQLFESRLDLSKSEDISRWSQLVLEQAGVPDIVVNCAGTSTMDYVIDSKLEDWEKVFSINSTGLYLVSKIFAKAMVDAESRAGSSRSPRRLARTVIERWADIAHPSMRFWV